MATKKIPSEPGKDVVLGGLFGALGIALPWLFHLIPEAGKTFLPMHLPIITVGFLVSPAVAASVGLLTPLMSMLLTAMPPLHLAPLMSVELAVLAGSASLFYRRFRWPLYLSLILAIVLARATMAALMVTMLLWLAPALGLSAKLYGIGFIVAGLPGTALQLLVAPGVVRAVEKRESRALMEGAETGMADPLILEEARRYHGHLGPWLVVGIRIGQVALEQLQARKHFGVAVRVECIPHPPPSCLVDGLQFSTGATYGKRNIELIPAEKVRVVVRNQDTDEALEFGLREGVPDRFAAWLEAEGDEAAAQRVAELPASDLWLQRKVGSEPCTFPTAS